MMEDEDNRSRKGNNKARELELLAVRNIMKIENGRSFMWRQLQQTRVFETIFTPEPHQHSFNAGGREHGLWLIEELKEAAPEFYVKMIEENIDG